MLITRAQLQNYTNYPERLAETPGDTLPEIREAGFDDLISTGHKKAWAGVGAAATRGVAFGTGIVAGVRLLHALAGNGSAVPGLVIGAVAAGSYLASRGLAHLEESLGQEADQQVHFLRDLDEAQLQLAGIPADPWIFV